LAILAVSLILFYLSEEAIPRSRSIWAAFGGPLKALVVGRSERIGVIDIHLQPHDQPVLIESGVFVRSQFAHTESVTKSFSWPHKYSVCNWWTRCLHNATRGVDDAALESKIIGGCVGGASVEQAHQNIDRNPAALHWDDLLVHFLNVQDGPMGLTHRQIGGVGATFGCLSGNRRRMYLAVDGAERSYGDAGSYRGYERGYERRASRAPQSVEEALGQIVRFGIGASLVCFGLSLVYSAKDGCNRRNVVGFALTVAGSFILLA